jgi:hypothetical protein
MLSVIKFFVFIYVFNALQGKKDVAQVFNNILRRQIGTRSPTVEYICTKPEILFTLMAGQVEHFIVNIYVLILYIDVLV